LLLVVGVIYGIGSLQNIDDPYGGNTITVSGTGEVFAEPDIAEFSFVIKKEGEDVEGVQGEVSEVAARVFESLRELDIADADMKTTGYNSYPRYEWNIQKCINDQCDRERELVGYELSQTTTVKVRDLSSVSSVLSVLGTAKVETINGPTFRIEDRDIYKAEAREQAVEEAKEKAEALASSLGVKLGKVSGFWERDNGGSPEPYFAESMDMAMVKTSSALPEISAGEDRITASVDVTYKIK
jgi:uncharacterized protein YggE